MEQLLVIEASPAWRAIDLREVWRYRELLYFFVWRDVKVRYKQTALGVTWAVIQPLFAMIVFTFFFGRVAKLPSDGVPYPVFAYAALLPWTFFSNAVSTGSLSVIGSGNLVTKVYFPRVLIPMAAVTTGIVDFVLAFVMLFPLMLLFHMTPSIGGVLWVPLTIAISLLLAFGVSVWLSALVVRYRDLRYVVPFVVQIWMFATPIIYPMSMVPMKYRWLVNLNPMAPVVEIFRASMFGRPLAPETLLWPAVLALVLIVSGSVYFRHLERVFADVI